MAAGVDGGLGELLFRMLDEQIACRMNSKQVCALQLLVATVHPGFWAHCALDCTSASRWPPLLTVFAFAAALQARNLLSEEIPLKNRAVHTLVARAEIVVWCRRPAIPNTILRTISYAKTHLVWQGRPLDLCLSQAGCLSDSRGHGP